MSGGLAHKLPILLGIVTLCATTQVRAQQDTVLVEAIVRMEIHDGPSRVVPALAHNGTLLLPFRAFVELAEVPILEYRSDDVATAVLEPGALRVRFLPDSGRFFRGDSAFSVGPLDAVWWDSELYLATEVIDRAFGVGTRMEWADLSAVIGQSAGLPVIRRARRERRRAWLERAERPMPQPFVVQPRDRIADGAVMQWSLSTPTADPIDNLSMDLGLGAKLVGGSLELRHFFHNATIGNQSQWRASWSKAWPEQRWVRQVGIGDVSSSGLRSRSVQGFSVTNAPFIRASEFDVEDVLGRVPAGWEVELYDRGRLRAFDLVDTLGAYQLPLQLRYGQNPFELVLYGPGGEVVRQTKTIRVPFSRLPKGQLEYAAAAGRCRYQTCDALASADVRYGLNSKITLQAGSDYFWRSSNSGLWQPYAAVSAAVLPPLRLTGEAVYNGQVRGSIGLEPDTDFRAEISHAVFDDAGAEFSRSVGERHRTAGSVFWRPGGVARSTFLHATALHSTGPAIVRSIQRVSATTRFGRIRSSIGLRHDRFGQGDTTPRDRTGVDLTGETILSSSSPWLHTVNARATVSFDVNEGLAALGGGLGRQIGRTLRFDVGVGWLRDVGYTLRLDFTTIMPGPRFGSRNNFSSQGTSSGMMFFDGSAVLDPGSRSVRWSDGRDLGRAGLKGVVFLDENGNGVREGDERGLSGVPVLVGGWYDETDEYGRFSAWDLFPFEAAYVEVDSLSFDDPRLVLPNAVIRVSPTPNSFVGVDIPVIVGAEISGYVLFENDVLAGIPVELRNLTTGGTTSLLTFSDGGFYKLGVLPGEYDIAVPEYVLEQLGATGEPIRLSVPSEPGEKLYEDLAIRLERVR